MASKAPTRSGWRLLLRLTKNTTSAARSRPDGGVVWKTLGEEGPPVVNVNGPRYGVIHGADRRVLGLNNIELITDRSLEINLEEITQVKKDYPDRAIIVSIMVPCDEESWKSILPKVEATGADGIELNFG